MRPTSLAAGSSSQLAASADSVTAHGRGAQQPQLLTERITCLLQIFDVTRVRHAQATTLSILRVFAACAAAVQTAVLVLFGPSCLGHYRPLQRRSASDKCSVRCRSMKQRDKIYRSF